MDSKVVVFDLGSPAAVVGRLWRQQLARDVGHSGGNQVIGAMRTELLGKEPHERTQG